VQFGLYSLPTYFPQYDGTIPVFYERMLSFLVESEALGFDSIWVNEHHFHPYGGMIPQPPVLLAMVAGRTHRLRLGTSVAVLPLHHPLSTAESYAMVDQLSGGRLEFGIGSGFAAFDHEVMGTPFGERMARTEEALAVVLAAWTQHPMRFSGRYYQFPAVDVWPPPRQQPHPPIWAAATRNPETYAWIGARGYHLLTVAYVKPLEELAALIATYREAARAHGHDPAKLRVSSHFQVYVSENGAAARRQAEQAIANYLAISHAARSLAHDLSSLPRERLSIDRLLEEGRALAGTPDEVATLLQRAIDTLGLTQVDCTFFFGGIPYEEAYRSFTLFAREVMPRFKPLPAPAGAKGAGSR
jgi:natural product biosynthesis luciferase-like monooxygenase protein